MANSSRASARVEAQGRGDKSQGGLGAGDGRRAAPPLALADVPAEVLVGYYRQMKLVRAFELRASEMYTKAKIGGYCHLNLGEEATVVGLMAALRPTDYLFTTYREHGYALARGAPPGRVMAELFGKATGSSRGWGGSMHLFDASLRLMGGYGIVGGQIPPATGAALAIAYRSGPRAGQRSRHVPDGRRDHEHRGVPREPQPGRFVAAAHRLRDSQQRPGHGDAGGPGVRRA